MYDQIQGFDAIFIYFTYNFNIKKREQGCSLD
jgi:hypothetical protein